MLDACPTKSGGSSPTAKAGTTEGPKTAPTIASAAVTNATGTEATVSATSSHPTSSTTTSSAEAATSSAASALPEGELKSLLQEASAMLKEIRQLKMMALSSTQVENQAVGHKCNPRDGRTGLLDSGASHPFRQATEDEICEADLVRVQLADGMQGGGSMSGAQRHSPLPKVRVQCFGTNCFFWGRWLRTWVNCQATWTRRGGLVIRHPEHGVVKPMIQGRCPVVAEAQALDLIREIECEKLKDLQGPRGQRRDHCGYGMWRSPGPSTWKTS